MSTVRLVTCAVCVAFLAGVLYLPAVADAQQPVFAPSRFANDSERPGSVLVFPRFLRGTVTVPGDLPLIRPRTEIEISVTCPRGATCSLDQPVRLKAQWICPPAAVNTPCLAADFFLMTSVNGTIYINPENIVLDPRGHRAAATPPPGCTQGYLIVWVVNTLGQAIKFDGLIGDAVIRRGPIATGPDAGAYNAIPIQAAAARQDVGLPPLNTGDLTDFNGDGNLDFDAREYQGLTGRIFGTVRYNKVAAIVTELTLLTLNVRSNMLNNDTLVGLRFYNELEQERSTSVTFNCWRTVSLTTINAGLTDTFGRKGLVISGPASKVAAFGIDDPAGRVTLMGLVTTLEFVTAIQRSYMYALYHDDELFTSSFQP